MNSIYDPNEYEKAYDDYEKLLGIVESEGYKKGWAFYMMRDKYGEWLATLVVHDYEASLGGDKS